MTRHAPNGLLHSGKRHPAQVHASRRGNSIGNGTLSGCESSCSLCFDLWWVRRCLFTCGCLSILKCVLSCFRTRTHRRASSSSSKMRPACFSAQTRSPTLWLCTYVPDAHEPCMCYTTRFLINGAQRPIMPMVLCLYPPGAHVPASHLVLPLVGVWLPACAQWGDVPACPDCAAKPRDMVSCIGHSGLLLTFPLYFP